MKETKKDRPSIFDLPVAPKPKQPPQKQCIPTAAPLCMAARSMYTGIRAEKTNYFDWRNRSVIVNLAGLCWLFYLAPLGRWFLSMADESEYRYEFFAELLEE